MNNVIFVIDNIPFHKSITIRNYILSNNHRILYLPQYSPFLNPIVNLFAQWKHIIKTSNCTDEYSLINRISSALIEINIDQCNNYYRNMLKFLPKCLNNEKITNR
ncbi:hypothetical protein DMUE_3563 [Dictyocoela muelleri]|nr:hypothetical protein DMUE_3563 [Dictyocoela muelleri]